MTNEGAGRRRGHTGPGADAARGAGAPGPESPEGRGPSRTEALLREHAPQVLGALVRRYGHFDQAEDAVQEALLAASGQWPEQGAPDNPRGWLIKVASRRLVDQLRAEQARRRREESAAALSVRDHDTDPAPGESRAPSEDDTLTLLFLCCDPSLTPAAQVALTLRAVGGLTTAEIARAHLVPEATMAQRISRAKQKLKGARFRQPGPDDRDARLDAVLKVLYLIYNEGHTATSGTDLHRAELAREAIRLTRAVRTLLPQEGAVAGLLALMLLTEARSPARCGADGALVPLDEQDRTRWDAAAVEEGLGLVREALARSPVGPYQLQAAIAAVHDEAKRSEDTDWPQILGLYDVLVRQMPDPMARLGRAVAVAMVHGPEAGLTEVDALGGELGGHHRLYAVRAHLLERAGRDAEAGAAYRSAAEKTLSAPEADYLRSRALRLGG
ncbi:sigma-70 family RNA polymerase sigma factor [Streptomyces sp. YIM 130001]|uniref:RNA polymerase sigma factor n=1 Tax=Streptomyces sp. YIM 130001 TaxID=2259644 RepID=UPI000E64912C|nr:sigma-70 family RNA polymerase sigma factor [Streptomyces sp. YIM 130001]